jgi:hypothetical protein
MTQHAPRKLRRLYERREKMVDRLREMFRQRWSESSDPRDLESEA